MKPVPWKTIAPVLAGMAGLAWLLLKFPSSSLSPAAAATRETIPAANSIVPSNAVDATRSGAIRPSRRSSDSPSKEGRLQEIQNALVRLRAGAEAAASRNLLDELQQRLVGGDSRAEAVEVIQEFLRLGEDAKTGLGFRVGPHHALRDAPTLRTALLDWLGELDRAAAGRQATEILEAMLSPDEVAIALRNFAWGFPGEREQLAVYFTRLLHRADWAEQPSGGYLESFDLVPYLGNPAFVKSVGPFLSPTSTPEVRNASLVALDRLVLANPAGTIADIVERQALADQPLVRATFLARADPRDTRQRALLERYLLSVPISAAEFAKFIRVFPNGNRNVSHNLLTDSAAPMLADLAAIDRSALELVRAWAADPRFAAHTLDLAQLRNRLEEQAASAARGGYLPQAATTTTRSTN